MLALLLLFAAASRAPDASAEASCGRPGKPWVSVSFTAGTWPGGLRESVLGDLRAGLARHDIDVCADGAGPAHPWLASARIAWLDEPRVLVSVEIRDKLTEKRLNRDVDLTSVPRDGRAFAIALATDELVWASWVELAIEPEKERAAPREVVSGVAAELPRRSVGRIGAQAAFEHFAGGATQFGADAILTVPLFERLRLESSAGVRSGREVAALHGRVSSSAFGLGFAARYVVVSAGPVELSALAGMRGSLMRFEGRAEAPATGSSLSGPVLTARAGLLSALRAGGGFWLELAGTAGAALVGLDATDAGNEVSGASGVELAACFGFGVEL